MNDADTRNDECLLCFESIRCAALSPDPEETPQGTKVRIVGGILYLGAAEKVRGVVWEGDARLNTPLMQARVKDSAVRPDDITGFVHLVEDRVKSKVQLAPTLELALQDNLRTWPGLGFENPRRVDPAGSPMIVQALLCTCVVHVHCLAKWSAEGTGTRTGCPNGCMPVS